MQNKGSELPKEHILVCLSSSPSNERIVRMAGKMAQAFSGSLTALYVQTPGDADMNAEDTVRLQVNMRLAQQLGAEIVTTHGEDVATQIAEYVRLSDVTKIVIGRSGVQRRHFWSEPTLTERLIALAPEVDIHIIPDVEAYKSYRRKRLLTIRPAFPTAWELLLTIGILAAATVIGLVFLRLGFANANIIMVYLLGVLLTSAFTSGYTCGVLSAFLSVILFNYFLTEPRLSLAAYHPSGVSDRMGTASDHRDSGSCDGHRIGLSAARLCKCQYHHGLPAGGASDFRFYQRIYLRCAVRFFECHPVQLFSDGTQAVFGSLRQ